jgi:hypothetical protein
MEEIRDKEYEKMRMFNTKQSCIPIQQGVEVTVFLRYSSPQPFTKDILNQRDGSGDCSQIANRSCYIPLDRRTCNIIISIPAIYHICIL